MGVVYAADQASVLVDRAADKVYARGGFGTYPSGSRHTDSRGSQARWSSFKVAHLAQANATGPKGR
jgi:hypothetical protein